MQAETKQKMDASQVICEKCGELCDFKCDRCPNCDASLFGDDLQPYEDESQNESTPIVLKLPELPDLHYTEPSQLSPKDRERQILILKVFLIIITIMLAAILFHP